MGKKNKSKKSSGPGPSMNSPPPVDRSRDEEEMARAAQLEEKKKTDQKPKEESPNKEPKFPNPSEGFSFSFQEALAEASGQKQEQKGKKKSPFKESPKEPKPSGKEAPKFNFNFGNVKVEPEDEEEEEEEDPEYEPGTFNISQFANNPELINMLQRRMGELIGQSSGYLESLPREIQQRIQALKQLHEEKIEIEKEYQDELLELEKKYEAKFSPLYEKRADIITGKLEPTPEERGERIYEVVDEEAKQGEEKAKSEKSDQTRKGIPEFWLQVLKHDDSFGEMITERDEEALKYLINIISKPVEDHPESFVLEFHFESNPFFEDKVLTKTYYTNRDERIGEIMYDHVDCSEIHWKPGKNLTVKKVTKQKGGRSSRGGRNKGKGKPQTITVEEPTDSFFNFFYPDVFAAKFLSQNDEDDDEPFDNPDDQVQDALEADYELGIDLKEKIIPNAVLWFTGEIHDEEDYLDDDDYYDEDDYNSEEDEDYEGGPTDEAPECKQQ